MQQCAQPHARSPACLDHTLAPLPALTTRSLHWHLPAACPLHSQSYYGEQKLHYLPADPALVDKVATVDLKEGPVHDVQVRDTRSFFTQSAFTQPFLTQPPGTAVL